MRSLTFCLACGVFSSVSLAATTTTNACPLLGAAFPAPNALSSDKQFQAAMKDFDNALTQTLETGISAYGSAPFNASTMSIGLFSTTEDGLLYERHYADPVVSSSTIGTNKPNADSVYRLGSISKLIIAYLFLVQEGDQRFDDPITKYIPELAQAASTTTSKNGVTPNWNEITVGQLASHMAGLAEDYGLDDTAGVPSPALPPLSADQIPTCDVLGTDGSFIPCTTQQYLHGVTTEPAFFPPGYTPVYSNNGYELLGIALENMTNSTIQAIFTKSIAKTLGLQHTSFINPNSTQNAVIPGNTTTSGWDSQMGALGPAGAYFSTLSDVALIGRSILNSTLLTPSQTRSWMKPVTFTSNTNVGVGAPWEIFRTTTTPQNTSSPGRPVDLYTKNGGWGAYGTIIVLIPDYNVGFSILTATSTGESPLTVYLIADMLAATLVPLLENIARSQANATFAGNYAASNLNSSLTISTDDQPGLKVTQWISNGTATVGVVDASTTGQYVDFRLQPNDLYSSGSGEVGFTATWQILPAPVYTGPFNLNCLSWGGADDLTYGNVPLAGFVFTVDTKTGVATGVQPKALRVTLERQR